MPCIPLKYPTGETGMICVPDGPFFIFAGGKVWCFEWHSYFGPHPIDRRTYKVLKTPSERSPFWTATGLWDAQGRRTQIGKGGRTFCMYDVGSRRRRSP